MKVLIFTTQFFQVGGAERLAIEIAEDLNKNGIHTDVASLYTENLPGVKEKKEILLGKGIPVVHFIGMRIHPSFTSLVPAVLKLRKLLRDEAYDIIETSQVSPTVIASWATLFGKTRHVAGLHQVFRRDRENSIQHKFWRFSVWFNPWIRYYAISDAVSENWIRYSNTSPKHIRRIYNSIPDECYKVVSDKIAVSTEFGVPNGSKIIIYVGRLAAYKGIDIVLDALAPILEQKDVFLFYIGAPDLYIKGTVEMIKSLENRITKECLEYRVRFLGYRSDVPRLMASASLLIHPTHIEGFGLVLAEAMAAGLQIVATNVEGIPEVLRETDSIMVSPGDPDALRNAVIKTLERNHEEITEAIRKGRRRAEKFRIKQRTNAIINLFKDVLNG